MYVKVGMSRKWTILNIAQMKCLNLLLEGSLIIELYVKLYVRNVRILWLLLTVILTSRFDFYITLSQDYRDPWFFPCLLRKMDIERGLKEPMIALEDGLEGWALTGSRRGRARGGQNFASLIHRIHLICEAVDTFVEIRDLKNIRKNYAHKLLSGTFVEIKDLENVRKITHKLLLLSGYYGTQTIENIGQITRPFHKSLTMYIFRFFHYC